MDRSSYPDQDSSASFAQLRQFEGSPTDFWPLFLRCAREVSGANRATLVAKVARPAADGEAVVESWRLLVSFPSGGATVPGTALLDLAAAEGIAQEGKYLAFLVGAEDSGEGVVVLETEEKFQAIDPALWINLLAALPEAWQADRTNRKLQERLAGLTGALDLSLVVGSQGQFASAAFAVCNELAARLHCDRVSLGWQDDVVLRLRAISQADKFDVRSKMVRQVEAAMEETFDQDETLCLPPLAKNDSITREHAVYAEEAQVAFLCSLPLRKKGRPCGVWMLERSSGAFEAEELALLRVMADQVGPRLADLRERERLWPVRLWRKLKTQARGFLGPRHTGPKLAGLAAALTIVFLLVGRLPYSVEAPATVRSGQVVFVTAPFDGFIEDVFFETGDTVEEGSTLVAFDTRELLVQQAAEIANLNRFKQEVERARAENALADMRVAEAQADQANAVLQRTRYHLEQAVIKAPMDGVIVEGDLRKRIGAPVRQGDVLFQQARLDELYVQIDVPEENVHEVLERKEARMLFSAQTDRSFPLKIERIQPAGQTTPAGVVFRIRAQSVEAPPEWWRPGMSGTAKIDAGWRNAGWILTHRTSDWLRRQLWW